MDVVVTVPKSFGLKTWIEEGDLPGEAWSGNESHFYLGGNPPVDLRPGDRVYVVYNNKLRGYAPLVRVERFRNRGGYALVRRGGAVAVTIPQAIRGFQGARYRWWEREDERPFQNWKIP